MFWGSKVGKLHLRDKIIASMSGRGDEQVLDVGCGYGLMRVIGSRETTHIRSRHRHRHLVAGRPGRQQP